MRYVLAAIGSLKRGFYAEGCAHYADRLMRVVDLEIVEVRDRGQGQSSAASEALLARTASAHRWVLDERGTQLRSQQLAERIGALETSGVSRMALLVGGPDGWGAPVRDTADFVWSLSALTLPHEMARLVVLEQLYRAEMIRTGHPYHRR